MSSMLPVHRGSFFGPIWRAVATAASLAMPLFFITGIMLYLKRRKQKQLTRAAQQSTGLTHQDQNPWLVVYASQTGFAEQIAWRTAQSLQHAHIAATVLPIHQLTPAQLQSTEKALFIVSTYGQGEAPDHARNFAKKYLLPVSPQPDLKQLNYAVLALGDHAYAETFCAFGRQLDQWLKQCSANSLFDSIEVNNAAVDDLNRWNSALADITHVVLDSMVVTKVFDPWQMIEQQLLNAGSLGEPAYALKLTAQHDASWRAGDIAEIQTGNSQKQLQHFLTAHQLNGNLPVYVNNQPLSLIEALRYRNLRDEKADRLTSFNLTDNSSIQRWLDQLSILPSREYSIASIPEDGYLGLVVRQKQTSEGLGLGSGWLTKHLAPKDSVDLRIRTNESFHAPDDNRPVILIGNGTGIAGLLSILRHRERHGFNCNWLIFGERQQQHDFFFAQTLQQWLERGHLQQLDLAFSRDSPERIYVQQRLGEQKNKLIDWVNQGASIYVCGSIDGMAPEVDQVLTDILGEDTLARLRDTGHYRRDVY